MDRNPYQPRNWHLAHGKSLELGSFACHMGILNVTPDSFSDGGKFDGRDRAVDHAALMIAEGAHIIDVGGESTKPGADAVSIDQEQQRVLPVIEAIAERFDTIISIDTYHAQTADLAIKQGAHMVNDVWGLQYDDEMAGVIAKHNAGACIMHNSRERKTADNLIEDQIRFLSKSIALAKKAGINQNHLVLDPGFGFGKSTNDCLQILDKFEELHQLGFPLLAGTSRKRFTGAVLGDNDTMEIRDIVTSATSVIARMAGCAVFRVHSVAINAHALKLADAVINARATT